MLLLNWLLKYRLQLSQSSNLPQLNNHKKKLWNYGILNLEIEIIKSKMGDDSDSDFT